MQTDPATARDGEFSTLLRAEAGTVATWITEWNARRVALHVGIIILGAGCFGAAMGWWRSPEQGMFVAIKFPLIILLTALGNALVISLRFELSFSTPLTGN